MYPGIGLYCTVLYVQYCMGIVSYRIASDSMMMACRVLPQHALHKPTQPTGVAGQSARHRKGSTYTQLVRTVTKGVGFFALCLATCE
jgi:hypothetical protein